jgi:hypothetical protein
MSYSLTNGISFEGFPIGLYINDKSLMRKNPQNKTPKLQYDIKCEFKGKNGCFDCTLKECVK